MPTICKRLHIAVEEKRLWKRFPIRMQNLILSAFACQSDWGAFSSTRRGSDRVELFEIPHARRCSLFRRFLRTIVRDR